MVEIDDGEPENELGRPGVDEDALRADFLRDRDGGGDRGDGFPVVLPVRREC